MGELFFVKISCALHQNILGNEYRNPSVSNGKSRGNPTERGESLKLNFWPPGSL